MSFLEVTDLTVAFPGPDGPVAAVRDLSFRLEKGETLGIVGESGCGKSLTALAIMGLLPEAATAAGAIKLDGEDLMQFSEPALCQVRGNRIAMIFQEPMTSLNPLHTIGRQIAEPMRLHRGLDRRAAEAETVRLLERVGLPDPQRRLGQYPHQFSGGQRQRIMIALALSCGPDILIADEPTTALDVTIQGQILDLINEIIDETGMALILISHDLGVISETTDRVMVMYGGRAVEVGPTDALFKRLAHPYAQGLFAAMPRLGLGEGQGRLATIPGTVPALADMPAGCAFADRCPLKIDACVDQPPALEAVEENHRAACHRLEESLKTAETGL